MPKVGSTHPTPIQDQDLMSHQDRLGNNGPQTTGLTKPDDGDDRMQNNRQNVAHVQDGIKLKKLENSGRLRNSPPNRFGLFFLRRPWDGLGMRITLCARRSACCSYLSEGWLMFNSGAKLTDRNRRSAP